MHLGLQGIRTDCLTLNFWQQLARMAADIAEGARHLGLVINGIQTLSGL
jgi:hypothetical protein